MMGSAPPLKPCIHPILQGSIAAGSVNMNQRVEQTGGIPPFTTWDMPDGFLLSVVGPSGTMMLKGSGTLPQFVPLKIKGWPIKVISERPILPQICTRDMCFFAEGNLQFNIRIVRLIIPSEYEAEMTYRWTVGPDRIVYGAGTHTISGCVFYECIISHISVRRV